MDEKQEKGISSRCYLFKATLNLCGGKFKQCMLFTEMLMQAEKGDDAHTVFVYLVFTSYFNVVAYYKE